MIYRGHEIKEVLYSEQCKEYYEAKERNDGYAMHIFFIPPFYVPFEMIRYQMRMIDLKEDLKEEMERIEKMDPELLELEIKLKIKHNL